MIYSIDPKEQRYFKRYGLLTLAKNMGKNFAGKCRQKNSWLSKKDMLQMPLKLQQKEQLKKSRSNYWCYRKKSLIKLQVNKKFELQKQSNKATTLQN